MFDLYEELRKITKAFDKRNIEYALCGGLAMAVYDHARATIDIDFANSFRFARFSTTDRRGAQLHDPGTRLSFADGAIEIRRVSKIHPTTRHVLTLDMLLVTAPIRDVWDARVEADLEDGTLSVVSREGLIALKKFRNSGRDMDDIALLREDIADATN